MKIIAMGDVHGRNFWKMVAGCQSFDLMVLLGDYFDSPHIRPKEQIANFLEILDYKKANPEHFILLTGNHDIHYLPEAMEAGEAYTGFQESRAFEISLLIKENLHLLQMCYQWENYLFTHAGVTNTWLHQCGYEEGSLDIFINELFRYRPAAFFFRGPDPYGDNIPESPIWVRPGSLRKDAYREENIRQIVGHTSMKKLDITDGQFFFIDTQGTSGEYLVLNDGLPSIEHVF